MKTLSAVCLVASMLCGIASNSTAGPPARQTENSPSAVAIIESGAVHISAIDNSDVPDGAARFEVSPGGHSIDVRLNTQDDEAATARLLTIEMEATAGRVYTVQTKREKDVWRSSVVDRKTGELVGLGASRIKGGEPRPFSPDMTRPIQLSGPDPAYSRKALEAYVQGLMIVKCVLTTEGVLADCRVIKPLPFMTAPVLKALYQRRYQPVTEQGKPVEVDYVFNIRLELGRRPVEAGVSPPTGAPPDPATFHREQGDRYLRELRWKEAAEEFGKALHVDPSLGMLWERKAYAHWKAGEFDEADAAIMKTLELEGAPTQDQKIETYFKLANTYLQGGQIDRAEKYFLMINELNPGNDVALGWLAELYARRGGARTDAPAIPEMLEKSFEYYDQAIEARPDLPNSYFNKRIAIAKYLEWLQQQIQRARQEIKANKKDRTRVKELQEQVAQHQARAKELRRQYEAISDQALAVVVAWKAAQAAAQGQDAGQPPAGR